MMIRNSALALVLALAAAPAVPAQESVVLKDKAARCKQRQSDEPGDGQQ
jgi:hypothetical protein